ncbi:helix-turn-helix transcriptional regulator [Miniphocaeibacter massiliensis]|uniref:helix-turn-helix transcriptional regulator n=1 Tax=Miniphocaeibacter massiliensis TaxID=2041841 RepID=UPI000C1B846B|nr:helix-turn-helix transcriptional regulator [Miniphocaeibacter massiliensis]
MDVVSTKRLKKKRVELGISQEEMAKKLGYNGKSGYSMLENGHVSISLDKAKAIANILNSSIEEIFFGK